MQPKTNEQNNKYCLEQEISSRLLGLSATNCTRVHNVPEEIKKCIPNCPGDSDVQNSSVRGVIMSR